jgi:hypothetical protein
MLQSPHLSVPASPNAFSASTRTRSKPPGKFRDPDRGPSREHMTPFNTALRAPSFSVVELPGIEPDVLPGLLRCELRFRSASVRFSTSRYLRFHFES